MTRKYLEVRREIYEKNPSRKVNSYRSFKDMVRLFKLPYWIMLVVLIIALIGLITTVILTPEGPYVLIIMLSIIVVLLLSQIPREKYFFNKLERENELSEKTKDYEQYIAAVWDILKKHGIDNNDKILKLRTECETALKMRDEKFSKINNRIVDMLIGVPLGALIASIIYSNNTVVPTAIGTLILCGLAILGVIKLAGSITFYSEGYFKDKYLLDAVNELNYFDKI